MFERVALQGAHVHGNTLCVTFGAPHLRINFRFFTLCSKYTIIRLVLGTHVLWTTLCVTFGTRPRPLPSVLLQRLFGQLGRQDRPRTPERFRLTPVWTPNVANECPPRLSSACPQLHPDLPSGIFRRGERHAHEVARREVRM